MSSTLTRFDLIDADASDGRVDGFVREGQLERYAAAHGLDPCLVGNLKGEGLIDDAGLLPYDRYIESFMGAGRLWDAFSRPSKIAIYSTDIEKIPAIEMMALGMKMLELEGRLVIGFEDPAGRGRDAAMRLKSDSELSREADLVAMAFSPIEGGMGEGETMDCGVKFEADLRADKVDSNPRKIFRRSAEKFAACIEKAGVIDLESPVGMMFEEEIHSIDVYKYLSPKEKEEFIRHVKGLIAYEARYLYPKLETCVWGGAIKRIVLSFDRTLVSAYWRRVSENPFERLYNEDGSYRESWYGYVDHSEKTLALDAGRVRSDVYGDSSCGEAGSYKGKSALMHEAGHMIWSDCYPTTFYKDKDGNFGRDDTRRQVAGVSEFFANLDAGLYYDLFVENNYGNVSYDTADPDYDPASETHSRLAELSTIGADFPEAAAKRISKSWRGSGIKVIYESLGKARDIMRREWGFVGHPDWADALIAANPYREQILYSFGSLDDVQKISALRERVQEVEEWSLRTDKKE